MACYIFNVQRQPFTRLESLIYVISYFVFEMKKFVLVILSFILVIAANAQITVSNAAPYNSANYLVNNILLGNGVTASNVTYAGQSAQIGFFAGGLNGVPALGLDSGVVLSSGDVNDIPPGGNQPDVGQYSGPGDPDLLSIAQSVISNPLAGSITSINDAAFLEFDFTPVGDSVKFRFVFASEEYPGAFGGGFINSTFNDVFAFFISGPGIAGPYAAPGGFPGGAINVAVVPGTNIPITISSIYVDPTQTPPSLNPQYYISNTTEQSHEFNGFTTPIDIEFAVQCGQTYHFKIAIADAQDDWLDTGVFIEAGSFSSNSVTLNSNVAIGGNDSVLFEGCGSALLDFIRTNTADTAVFNFNVTGTAGGADYTISADSVVFLPGQDTVTLTFSALQDGLTEPLETVIIQLVQTVCSIIDTQTVTFFISDYPQPILTTHDTLKNCGSINPVPVWVNVSGPPYTTLWNTGATTDTIWVNPFATTTYYVTVSDTCGVYVINDSATVTVVNLAPIVITTSNDSSKYCQQDSIWVYASASGGGGGFTYNWNSGGVGDSIFVSPGVTTTYIVDVQDACGTIAQDSVIITVPIFVPLTNLVTTNDTIICAGEVVTLNANIAGGVGTYLSWNNGIGNVVPTNVNPVVTTNYILTAQDSCGAIVQDSVLVTINSSTLQVSVPNYTMSCLNENVTLTANVVGGNGSETYLWSTGAITTSIQVAPTTTTNYTLTVNDVCSSYNTVATVTVPVFAPLVLSVNNNTTLNCPGDPIVLSASFVGGAQPSLLINWSDGINNFIGNNITVNPTVTTTYTATVNDTCAFDNSTTSFTVTVPNHSPLQLVMSNDTTICAGDTLTLFATASGGDGTYNYSWNGGFSASSFPIQPNFDRNYFISVTDGCGTQVDSMVTVNVTSSEANFSYEYISEFTVEFTDSSYNNIISNWWTFGLNGSGSGTNPIHTFDTDGAHDVLLIVQDINGCYDTIMKTIRPPIFIYGPNSFTPDGDGVNDVFRFKGMGIEFYELLIYNRWGELMFKSSDIKLGWDGTYKGKPVPLGAYIYKVRAESFEKRVFENIGSISLFK